MQKLLETERFVLRECGAEDLDDLYRLNSDPDVMRYVGPGTVQTLDQAKQSLKRIRNVYEKHPGYGAWFAIDKASHEFLGVFLLVPYPETDEVEVGYRLFKEHWGKGYATEGTKALIEYGFKRLGLDRIIAIAYPQNKASIRVMEKSGMRYKGIVHNEQLDLDVVYYVVDTCELTLNIPAEKGSDHGP